MIDLSIDISYLSRYYGVSMATMLATGQMGGTKSVGGEENGMMTIVTEEGTIRVDAELLRKLLREPEKLAKLLRLEDPNNRYLIIQQLNEEDLAALLPFLTSEQLAKGLQFFTIEGLSSLMIALPQEQMINLLLEQFTIANVVPFMEGNELSNFFSNSNLEKADVMKYFEQMEYEKFQELMVNQFGKDFEGKTTEEYLNYINNMQDQEYKQFLQNMTNPQKMDAIVGICTINPDYYQLIDNSILVRPMIALMEKTDIIKTMSTLDPEFLVPMIEELPENLMQLIATQIDPENFADMLSQEFPDLIMEMLAG